MDNVSIDKGFLINKFHIVKNRIIFSLNKKEYPLREDQTFLVSLILEDGNFITAKMGGNFSEKIVNNKKYGFFSLKFYNKEIQENTLRILQNIFGRENAKNLEGFKDKIKSIFIKIQDDKYQTE